MKIWFISFVLIFCSQVIIGSAQAEEEQAYPDSPSTSAKKFNVDADTVLQQRLECRKAGKSEAECEKETQGLAEKDAYNKNAKDRKIDSKEVEKQLEESKGQTYASISSMDFNCLELFENADPGKVQDLPDSSSDIMKINKNYHYTPAGCGMFFTDSNFTTKKNNYTEDDKFKICGQFYQMHCNGKDHVACFKANNPSVIKESFQPLLASCSALNKAALYNSDVGQLKAGCSMPASYTLDYKACVRTIDRTTMAMAGAQMGNMGADVNQAKGRSDLQADLGARTQSQTGNSQEAALNTQKKSFENDATTANIKAGAEGLSSAVILHSVSGFPTLKNLARKGGEFRMNSEESAALANIAEKDPQLASALFANVQIKEQARTIGIQSLMKGLIQAAVAMMHKKRAKSVGNVQKALADASFNNPENQFDLGPTYCEQNPTVPACQGSGTQRSINSMPTISFGGAGAQGGGNLNVGNADLDGDGSSNNNAAKPSQELIDDLGDIIGSDNNSDGSNDFNKVGAANVTNGSSGGGGGGSGGGGGAAGGGGGGGGSGPEAKQGPSDAALGKKVGANYTAGGTMAFAKGGTLSKKDSGDANPFDNLFKKSSDRAIASQDDSKLLSKESKIFTALSERYKTINNDGRLEKMSDE